MVNRIKAIARSGFALGLAFMLSATTAAPAFADGALEEVELDSKEIATAILESLSSAAVHDILHKVAVEKDPGYYEILLGGEVFATFEAEADARGVVKSIEDHFAFSEIKEAKVSYEPSLEINRATYDASGSKPVFTDDVNKVITKLVKGDGKPVTYETTDDDTLWGIAQVYGVGVEDLLARNPGVEPETLSAGTNLVIKDSEPFLKVVVEYKEEIEREIRYASVQEQSDELYDGEKEVKQEGVNGKAKVVYQYKIVNGITVMREEISREVLVEAKDEIILVGKIDSEEEEEEELQEDSEYTEEEEYSEDYEDYEDYDSQSEEYYEDYQEEEYYYEEETYEEPQYVEETYEEPVVEVVERSYSEPAPAYSETAAEGQRIVDYALQFVGNPYSWGGTSLTNGADCSGFIYRVYNDCGYSVNRFPDYSGYQVPNSEMQPGDIIVYPHHYALYIGGGQCVEALNYENGICICPLGLSDSYYYTVRIVK